MAHNLFGNRFFGHREPAWHGLGVVSQTPMNGIEALTQIGGGHIVEKYPGFALIDGNYVPTGDFAIFRSPLPDDNVHRFFGHATDRYNVLSSLEVVELFDEKVKEPVETIGFLGKGERMFLTWTLPEFEVRSGDSVKMYGFIATGFDSLMGTSLNVVTVRVVCQNTWNSAISQAENNKERGKGRIWSAKHTSRNMKFELGEWMEMVNNDAKRKSELTQNFFKRLADTPLEKDEEVYRLLFAAYPNPEEPTQNMPESLKKNAWEKYEKEMETVNNDRTGIYNLFSGSGTNITPDYWGLFNASTEWFNWGKMAKKPVEYSVVLGNRSNLMNKMADVLNYESSK